MLLLAALFWMAVGFGLMLRGIVTLVQGEHYFLLAAALCLGTFKYFIVFSRTARKNVARIQEKEDGDCLGGVFSFKNWMLVVIMILMGRLLRLSGLSLGIYGVIVLAVGLGLFLASRIMWVAWKESRHQSSM